MEASETFKSFFYDLKNAFPEIITETEFDVESVLRDIEENFLVHFLKVIQRDETFFTEADRVLFGVNLSEIWKAEGVTKVTREIIWRHLQMCMIVTFFDGKIEDKIAKMLPLLKKLWAGKDDEISKVLNDDESQDRISEILSFILQTRLAKVIMEVMDQVNVSDLELNFSSPQEILEILKDKDHPTVKKIIGRLQNLINSMVVKGSISPQQLLSEMEAIKAKLLSLFGNAFSEALGGTKAGAPAGALMSSAPEARRQRMLARLQKKQRDKKSS